MFAAIFVVWILFTTKETSANTDCKTQALGMQAKTIKDEAITASSQKDDDHKPQFARLSNAKAWCSLAVEKSPYLQISLNEVYQISRIRTQGSRSSRQWVTKYQIRYKTNTGGWKTHQTSNGKPTIKGNSHFERPSEHAFSVPLVANAIQIYPTETIGEEACLRVELYGCKQPASCRDPGTPTNGIKIEGFDFGHGKRVRFSCNAGFQLVGKSSIQCQKGEWNGVIPQCKVLCPDPGIPKNGKIESGVHLYDGESIRYDCKDKFNLIGSSVITCLAGNWSSSIPVCKAPCSRPVVPQNGSMKGVEFGHGHQVTFECNNNFRLSGSSFLVCNDGQWSADVPQCKAQCSDPGSPDNGSRIGSNFIDGQTVAFTCNAGFDLVGSQILHCFEGKWNTRIPQCKAKCKDPGSPANGQRSGTDFSHGKKVRFVCQSGFRLTGSQAIICHDGAWSSSIPLCKESCSDPGLPQNGKRFGNDFRHGKRVTFACNSGFVLKGQSTSVCIAGNWSSSLPQCKANCKDPGSPANGKRIGNSFHDGETVLFKCNKRYTLIGPQLIRCKEGSWDNENPVCKASCVDPGSPKNGARQGSNFGHGQEVKFVCNSGFDLEGNNAAVCTEGKWNSSLPTCKGKCPDPGTLTDGTRLGNTFNDGQAITFQCISGFTLIGSRTIRCIGGQWDSAKPVCKASCTDPGFPKNGTKIGSNFEHGQQVRFACNQGFNLEGSHSSVCNNGRWTESLPACRDVNECSEGTAVCDVNAGCVNILGSYRCVCRDGFDGNGKTCRRKGCQIQPLGMESRKIANSQLSAQSSDRMLPGWFPSKARLNNKHAWCSKKKTPGQEYLQIDLQSIRHVAAIATQGVKWALRSYFVRTYSVKYSYDGRTWHSYEANGRKKVFKGNSDARSVTRNNLSDTFVTRFIRIYPLRFRRDMCLRVELYGCQDGAVCDNPGVPANGQRTGDTFQDGSIVEFSCSAGLNLIGSHKLLCGGGKWNSTVPSCAAVCSDPGTPDHGSRNRNWQRQFLEGEMIQFSCDSGFRILGAPLVICTGGQWNSRPPTCVDIDECGTGPADCDTNANCVNSYGSYRCVCNDGYTGDGKTCTDISQIVHCKKPVAPANAIPRPNKDWFNDGERISFICSPGYYTSGFSRQQCQNGGWNPPQPGFRCRPRNCGDPGTPLNGKRTGYLFSVHSTVKYICSVGFALKGPSERVCLTNGSWSGTTPKCKAVDCGRLPVPNRGVKTVETKTTFGGRVEFECPGYKLVGSASRTCQGDGQWSGQTTVCEVVTCSDPGKPANGEARALRGFVYGASVQFTCQKDYVLIGRTVIYCKSNGLWTGNPPRCLAPCDDPGFISNGGRRQGNNFKHGGTVDYRCKKGYHIVGERTLTCFAGAWNNAKPTCARNV